MKIRFKEGCDIDFFEMCQVSLLRSYVCKKLMFFFVSISPGYIIRDISVVWIDLFAFTIGMIFSCANISKKPETIFFELGWCYMLNGYQRECRMLCMMLINETKHRTSNDKKRHQHSSIVYDITHVFAKIDILLLIRMRKI